MAEEQRQEPSSSTSKKSLSASSCVYTSCYCEENVWKLCEKIRDEQINDITEYYAVFISNATRQIPLWMQRQKISDPLTPVVWDYHVILVRKCQNGDSFVYDLDCILAFPCHIVDYANQVLRSNKGLKKQYHRKFRVVQAPVFLSTFASDRSHMKKPNGEWIQEPPDYPAIRTADDTMNLEDFIDMNPDFGEGQVKDLNSFLTMFTS
eukprot:Seg418.14 transcript_id=Seg418.14/GoldUCD/mRNA.D3Y31 product="Protein N-terminal glutamine amidohydrolase" protein_id=Seg418.14/GoldUCD/D3Y31